MITALGKTLMMLLGSLLICVSVVVTPPTVSAEEPLTIATIERPPFMFMDGDQMSGFSVELWQQLAQQAGLNFQWKRYDQFSAMVDDTVDGRNAAAIANISITSDRERRADFTQPIFDSGMAIAVKKGQSRKLWQIIWESGFLIFIGGAFATLLLIAHVLWFFERNVKDARHDYFRDDYFGGLWDAFWWAFIIMTMGGFENEVPHKKISRLLAMIWIIVSLFFISTLTAKITTALTVAELKSDIESFQDLAGKRVGVTRGSSHERFLSQQRISTRAYTGLEDLYRDLRREKLDAIVADAPVLSYYAQQAEGDWMMLAGEPFNLEAFGILLPPGSSLAERLNIALLQMREDGSYRALQQKYFGDR